MTILVPFDGSPHAALALARAADVAETYGADLLAVTVVHPGVEEPVELGWLDPGGAYDPERVRENLEAAVAEIAPAAAYHVIRSETGLPRGAIAKHLRRFARGRDAELVFVGSESAGRIVTRLSSVGGGVSTEMSYDVYLVRRPSSSLFDDRDVAVDR